MYQWYLQTYFPSQSALHHTYNMDISNYTFPVLQILSDFVMVVIYFYLYPISRKVKKSGVVFPSIPLSLYILENLFYFGIQCVVLHNNIMCPAFYDTCRRHECDFGIFLQLLNGQRSAVAHGMLYLAQRQIDIIL